MAGRKKNNNNTEAVAGGKSVEQQPSGEFVDSLVKEPEAVAKKVKETSKDVVTHEKPKEQRIMATQSGVKLYSRPSMTPDAVIGTMPPNMSFGIKGRTNNPFGEFYKLNDGRYVSTGDAVKEI